MKLDSMADSNPNQATPRICGGCEACCYVAEVKEGIVNKPACQTCPFQKNGCSIFGQPERPQVCRDFQCSWLRGYGDQNDRPDLSGVMVSINHMNGGIWINVMNLRPNAFRTTGKNMILDIAKKVDLPVIIVDQPNLKAGMGDYVIIKSTLEPRSDRIRGKFIEDFSDSMKLYELVIR